MGWFPDSAQFFVHSLQYFSEHFINVHFGAVDDDCILCGLERRHLSVHVTLVPFLDAPKKVVQSNTILPIVQLFLF